jgi:hypothetical protein
MKDEVGINKQHLFQLGQIQRGLDVRAEARRPERPFSTGDAGVDRRALDDHLRGENAKRSVEALLEEALDSRPSFIQEPLKGSLGQAAPEVPVRCPAVFLEQSSKLVFLKPQKPNVSRIVAGMLGASHTLEVLVVEPIDVRMRIPRVPSTAIHLPTVHDPEVRDDINIGLRNIGGDIRVHKLGGEDGIHYSC